MNEATFFYLPIPQLTMMMIYLLVTLKVLKLPFTCLEKYCQKNRALGEVQGLSYLTIVKIVWKNLIRSIS